MNKLWLDHRRRFLLALFVPCFVALQGCEKKPSLGELTYQGTCIKCHANGLNGAPIFGNSKMWSKRVPQGIPTLIEHATNGYGLMPAKGGNPDLTNEEISAAVNYMVDQAQN